MNSSDIEQIIVFVDADAAIDNALLVFLAGTGSKLPPDRRKTVNWTIGVKRHRFPILRVRTHAVHKWDHTVATVAYALPSLNSPLLRGGCSQNFTCGEREMVVVQKRQRKQIWLARP